MKKPVRRKVSGTSRIIRGDILSFVRHYHGPKFHSIFCDAPYHLTSPSSHSGTRPKQGPFARVNGVTKGAGSKGFMNQGWDGGDLAFRPELWAGLSEHLFPGGFILCYGGSRTYHRVATAMEDAGLIIHPSIVWLQCLSSDTEILTETGWVNGLNVTKDHRVAQYDIATEEISFTNPTSIFSGNYNDTAYRIQSDNTDQLITRNHRAVVERGGKFVFRKAFALQRQEVVPILESLPEVRKSIFGERQQRVLQEDDLRIGFVPYSKRTRPTPKADRAEGHSHSELCCLRQRDKETQSVGQEVKRQLLFEVVQREGKSRISKNAGIQIAGGVDGKESGRVRGEDDRTRKSSLEGWGNLFSQAWQLCADKIRSVSRAILVNGSERWVRYGASAYCGASTGAAIATGRSGASLKPQSTGQSAGKSHAVQEQFRPQAIRALRRTATTLATITPVQYSGSIWCVEVPTGAFVARRNGMIFVTGNSQGMPKSTRIDTQIDKEDSIKEKQNRRTRFVEWMLTTGLKAGQANSIIGTADVASHYFRLDQPEIPTIEHFEKLKPYIHEIPSWVYEYVNERKIESETFKNRTKTGKHLSGTRQGVAGFGGSEEDGKEKTEPATELAKAWAGHRYGLQALCPSAEFVVVAQKPYKGRPIDNIVETGAGALNIDATRIKGPMDGVWGTSNETCAPTFNGSPDQHTYRSKPNELGRWPKNVVVSHSQGCIFLGTQKVNGTTGTKNGSWRTSGQYNGGHRGAAEDELGEPVGYTDENGEEEVEVWDCTPDCPSRVLGEQSGPSKSTKRRPTNKKMFDDSGDKGVKWNSNSVVDNTERGTNDQGTASRFFHTSGWEYELEEQILGAVPFVYQAKVGPSEREAGLDEVDAPEVIVMRTTGSGLGNQFRRCPKHGKAVLSGANTYSCGCAYVFNESDKNNKRSVKNNHPTLKPIALNTYLASLLLPPARYTPRRLLVPFSGAGSEVIGALLAGWDEVIGVELDAAGEYIPVARARIEYWTNPKEDQPSLF